MTLFSIEMKPAVDCVDGRPPCLRVSVVHSFEHWAETSDQPNMVAASIANWLYSKLSARVRKTSEQNDWPSQENRFQVLTQFHRTKPSLTLSNRSKRRPLRAHTFFMMSLSCVLLAGCNRTDPQLSFSAHTQTSIPPSAKLVHSGGQYAGVDASYGFVFDVSDTALQEQLVGEWNLQAATASESGFFKFAKHPWWPTDDALLKMDGHFGRSDEQKEEYWHVWHDRPNGKLYVEHGRW